MQIFDVIVLGAGAMGSAAAYHLAKAGARVLLLEQFEIDHQKGSSYGYSRIIRFSYNDPTYIKLAKATYPLWATLAEESSERLHIKTGGLDFGAPTELTLQDTITSLRSADIPFEILAPRDAEKRFPQFRFDDDSLVIYQADSGMLAPSKCVRAHVKIAQQHGATILDHTPVINLKIHADSVEVQTANEIFSAGRLVITAGSWAGRLLAETGLKLPLQPIRVQEAYFQPVNADLADYEPGRMPVFIYHRGYLEGDAMYGLPTIDGSGVKAARHGGTPFNHPDIDYTPDPEMIDEIRVFTRQYLPAIGDGRLLSTRICIYTMTPDEHFIIDQHPNYPHVAIGAGFSGHGFKFSAGIGSILCDLALRGGTAHDISLFKISRFEQQEAAL
jgi:monomeric sarcosine oxidase